MIRKSRWVLITGILLLPLFFINVKDSHDWGDDFAQYLIQARNLVEGRPQTDNGLVQNIDDPAYAIEAYPVGMPLILAPVYAFTRLRIIPYCILFSACLFLAGIFSFSFLRKRAGNIAALLIALCFCYNPNIIDLKKQILSEIPFMLLLILFLLWHESHYYRKKYSWLITSLLLMMIVSVRLAGLVVAGSFVLLEVVSALKENEPKARFQKFLRTFLSIMFAFLLFVLLNGILFPINPGGLMGFYSDAVRTYDIPILSNLQFYYYVDRFLFPFFGGTIPSFWIFFALAGWVIRLMKSPTLCEYIFPFYALMIVCYPYTNAGIRFFLPILPLLIFYLWNFIDTIAKLFNEKNGIAGGIVLIGLLTSCLAPLKSIVASQSVTEDGPHQKVSYELFNFILSTPEESVIVFCKARAISLYTERRTFYTLKNTDNAEVYRQFHRHKSLYLVIARTDPDNEIYDATLLNYITAHKTEYEHAWSNEHFDVYRQL